MADLEKVIKGLECCCSPTTYDCKNRCPYTILYEPGNGYKNCLAALLPDALALLKEHEPKQVVRKQGKRENSDGSIDYFAEWYCPHCGSLLVIGFDNKWIQFCPRCGKPINWEGK